ncbi:SDR family NAD(P)-dependent oxidoreductase [Methylorubrum sp. SL192]|uniref:SDR family NAD(P)-dependent oxidoreductase n=1 Tax=Methylorubrum sp. SL192 TaxID=2995167 RepID=UPI002273F2C6|nr:SDR family NAD(P)-dependent oxidoreductase [Methylorubrum sp. SL192]MCY1643184.1 SDR family NAD(P)-dependent oxidoreductase [Methylorubrum sp. SL192]
MTDTHRPLALVTGASSGIGYELARLFAADGHDVLITASGRNDGLERTADAVRATGVEAIVVKADLTEYDGVEALAQAVAGTGRPLAAAALNAGVDVGGYFVGGTDLVAELKMIQLNVASQVHLTKRLLPAMVERGAGRLLYTASISGTMPTPYEAVYGGTKAFLISFVEAVKEEVKDSGVSFTLLLPGEVDTPFWHRAGMDTTKLGLGEKAAPTKVAQEGYEAMKAGKDRVVAGKPGSKFIGRVLNNILPDTAKAAAHSGGAEPGSGLK